MLIFSKQQSAASAIRPRLMSLIFFYVLATVFVSVMEKHVVTPSWALFLAFAVFTAIIRHDPHPKRGALER